MDVAADSPDVVEVRPGPVRRWLLPVGLPLVATVLLLFGAYEAWVASTPDDYACQMLAGVFGFGAAFTVGTLGAALRFALRQPRVSLLLSPAGLTLCYPPGPGTIPWQDIETIGTVPDNWIGRTVGLRLSSYDALLETLSATARRDPGLPLDTLRARRGYEVQVPRLRMDRSLEEFVELLYGYWEEYGKK